MNNENLTPFKPGESGNPAGRPKGAKNLSTMLKDMLEEEIQVDVDGQLQKKKFSEILVRKLIQRAYKGDLNAIREVFDRTEGKAKLEIDQKTEHSGSIDITWQEPPVRNTGNQGSLGELPSLQSGLQDNL